jgi:hypothetical protein
LASFTPDDSISLVETLLQAEVSSQFAAELAEKREREQAQSRTQHLEHLIRRETAWLSRSDASVVEEALRKAARLAAPEVYDVAMEEAARAARRGVQDRVAQLRAAERQAEASEYDRQRAEHEARSQRRNAEHEQQVRKWREEDKQRADEAAWNRARQRLSADVSRSLPYGATAQERDAAVAAATGRLGELAGQCSVDEAVREVDALIQVHRASVARRIDSERRAADRSRAVNRWLGYLPRNVPLAERDELEGVLVAAYDRCDTWNFEQQAEKIIADYRK